MPHLRDAKGTGLAVDLLRGDPQCLRTGEQAVHLGVIHGDGVHRDAGILLKILIEGGHIVAQFVQLQQRIMEIFELKVGGQQTARHIVRRVLDRTEIVDLVGIRHDHHAAGMLAGGSV